MARRTRPAFFGREITDPADPNYDWDRPEMPGIQYQWRRGLLFEVTAEYLTVRLAQVLADSPAARTLQKLCLNTPAWNLGRRITQFRDAYRHLQTTRVRLNGSNCSARLCFEVCASFRWEVEMKNRQKMAGATTTPMCAAWSELSLR